MAVVITQGSKPVMGYERVTVDNTAGGVGLTSTAYQTFTSSLNMGKVTAKQAMIRVETASIRVSYVPRVAPIDRTTGHLYASGDVIWLETTAQIANFRAVRIGGSNAILQVTYFGE